ncbi:MAG: hypothetical protein FJ026_16500 [Chloroflexi bacterium]|nr:hypothetical protein [Chloroflexota bacterium]
MTLKATIIREAEHLTLLVSDEIVREYFEVLNRPKFILPSSVVDDLISYVLHKAEFVTPVERVRIVEADPPHPRRKGP